MYSVCAVTVSEKVAKLQQHTTERFANILTPLFEVRVLRNVKENSEDADALKGLFRIFVSCWTNFISSPKE